ncbi:MAG: ABC transporter substrate-binding protein [Candidatus Bipolaricaulota bacterium]|nr:ABC transporter substrate-binding protein [Candidatus Bipolaricaulota bacterium]
MKRSVRMALVLLLGVTTALAFVAAAYATDLVYARPSLGTKFLDPHQGGNSGRYQNLNLVYDTLVFSDDGGTLYPLLAEWWEASEDYTQWTFQLRSGIVFHDGTPLNAAAVKFSFDRIVGIGNHTVAQWRYMGKDSTIEVVDDLTVRFKLSKPYPLFLTELVYACYGIISPTAVQQHATAADPWATEYFSSNECGSGPFQFAEYVPGERLILAKNTKYWGGVEGVKCAAKVDRLVMRIVPDATTRAIMLQSGEVDIAEQLPVDLLGQLATAPGIKVEYYPLQAFAEIQFNGGKAPFNNEKVRQAISHAIDVDSIINGVERGHVLPMYGVATQGMIGYDPTRQRPTYDVALAKQLLAEAGYPNGFDATLIWATERRAEFDLEAVLIQEYLGQIGIRLTLQSLAWSAELEKQLNADFDMSLMTMTSGTGDPSSIFDKYLAPPHPAAVGQYSFRWVDAPPIVAELVEYGTTIWDPATRQHLYAFLDAVGTAAAVNIPLYQIPVAFAMRSNVHGFVYDTLRRACFYFVSKD